MPTHSSLSHFESSLSRDDAFQLLLESYSALSADLRNWVSNLANCSSLLWHLYHSQNVNVNWTGFYVKELCQQYFLGPFHGKVACQVIKTGHGVCGAAAEANRTILVPNVNEFPGHIACDGDTRSEIVVPVRSGGQVVALIDLDCLDYNGFTLIDQKYLEMLAELIAESCDWTGHV